MFKRVFGDDPVLAGELLSLAIGRDVGEVEVVHGDHESRPEPDSHAAEFDVYLRTKEGVIGDLEMQVGHRSELPLRLRAYLSNNDRMGIARGIKYTEALESYVIFICMFDPMGAGIRRYTIERMVRETGERFPDRQAGILLNAFGSGDDIPEGLALFLDYVAGYDGVAEGGAVDGTSGFVRAVDRRVRAVRADWEWRREYMTFEERLEDAREEGREQGREEERLALARGLVSDGILTPEDASARFGLAAAELLAGDAGHGAS